MPRVKSQTSLVRRGTVYWLRVHVPEDLRKHFNGSRDVRRSLRTKDKVEAVKLAAAERTRLRKQFEELRNGTPQIEIWEWHEAPSLPALFSADKTLIAMRPGAQPPAPAGAVLLTDLVSYWKGLMPRRPPTVAQVEFAVKGFIRVTGISDARQIDRQAIIKWRDSLLQERSPR